MAAIAVKQIIGQPLSIRIAPKKKRTSPPPFVIYKDPTAPPEHNAAENHNRVALPRMHSPVGPYIAPDGSIEVYPSPEEATQWFPDDEASLRIADHDLRAMIDRILLSRERQPSPVRFLACAIVKHFSYWLWLMKDKNHPFEIFTIRFISLVLKSCLMKAIHPTGLNAFEDTFCVQLEVCMTKQTFKYFTELCELVLDKNWATLGKLVDPHTDEPPVMVMEDDHLFGRYIKLWIRAMENKLQEEWISLEFLCEDERFTVPYPLFMVWEAQKNRLRDVSWHCERLLRKVEEREVRILREITGNARPDPEQVLQYGGKENRPPVVERRIGDGEGSFPDWQEMTLTRRRR
ncbi:hypothetical protein MMC15_005216 [Xylographa vitiligo]|nr:hypothetical protein [Xylographa vitiligo]